MSYRWIGGGASRLGLLFGSILLLGGCSLAARPSPPAPPAPPVAEGVVEEGIASWYGHPFHGRQTASGEVYDMEAPTAAHRTFPFGTRVRVQNLESGRATELRINDRGPFVRGRIIDVSRRGARELGLLGSGIARVRVEVLEIPAPATCWEAQVGAFRERDNAESRLRRLELEGIRVRLTNGPDGLTRVRAGPFPEESAAAAVAALWNGMVLAC